MNCDAKLMTDSAFKCSKAMTRPQLEPESPVCRLVVPGGLTATSPLVSGSIQTPPPLFASHLGSFSFDCSERTPRVGISDFDIHENSVIGAQIHCPSDFGGPPVPSHGPIGVRMVQNDVFDHNNDICPTFGCNKDENRSFGPIFDKGTPLHSGLSHFGSQNGLVTPPAIVPKIQKIGQDTRGTSTPPMGGSGEALNPIFGDFKGAVTHDFACGSFLHSVYASNVTPVEEKCPLVSISDNGTPSPSYSPVFGSQNVLWTPLAADAKNKELANCTRGTRIVKVDSTGEALNPYDCDFGDAGTHVSACSPEVHSANAAMLVNTNDLCPFGFESELLIHSPPFSPLFGSQQCVWTPPVAMSRNKKIRYLHRWFPSPHG